MDLCCWADDYLKQPSVTESVILRANREELRLWAFRSIWSANKSPFKKKKKKSSEEGEEEEKEVEDVLWQDFKSSGMLNPDRSSCFRDKQNIRPTSHQLCWMKAHIFPLGISAYQNGSQNYEVTSTS